MAYFKGLLYQLLEELRKSVKPSWVVASLWALRLTSGAVKYIAGMVTMLKHSVHHLLPSQIQQQGTTSAKGLMLCGE
jgi:hypothetical protein